MLIERGTTVITNGALSINGGYRLEPGTYQSYQGYEDAIILKPGIKFQLEYFDIPSMGYQSTKQIPLIKKGMFVETQGSWYQDGEVLPPDKYRIERVGYRDSDETIIAWLALENEFEPGWAWYLSNAPGFKLSGTYIADAPKRELAGIYLAGGKNV